MTGKCRCCNEKEAKSETEKKYGIRDIVVEFKLYINIGFGNEGAYGHEQHHMAMMIKHLDNQKPAIKKLFSDLESECKYKSPKECEDDMSSKFKLDDLKDKILPLIKGGYMQWYSQGTGSRSGSSNSDRTTGA